MLRRTMKQNTHPRVRGEGLSHAMWARSRESWYREPCGAWPCVVRGGGWWAAAGGGWTWACGLCSSPRGVAVLSLHSHCGLKSFVAAKGAAGVRE